MLILPLKFIREEDKKTVGINLFHLAKLNHSGISVVESAVVIAPVEIFSKLIEKYKKNYHNLKDQINNLSRSLSELDIPEALIKFNPADFSKKSENFNINTAHLWQNLLKKWSAEIISKVEREETNLLELTPQLIILSSNFAALGKGFFDEDRGHVVIETDKGKLEFKDSEEIEKIITAGNKKLILPQIFFWGIDEGTIKIIKVLPFTQSQSKVGEKIEEATQVRVNNSNIKTATKLYLNSREEVLTDLNCDGIILKINSLDIENINERILKFSNIQSNLKFLFYPDFGEDNVKNLEFAKTFLFFRNKKKLDASVVLPQAFSKDEYIKLKTDFASVGIYSKGSLKIWKEFKTVLDFLNMDDYLDAGFDGAIINLDEIVQTVTGVTPGLFLKEPKIDWISAVEKFFKELGFTKLIKNHKQVMVTGESVQNEELLNYFIISGVWGIAFEKNNIETLREHISFIEKQTIKKINPKLS